MKKTIRLTESDLTRLVKKVIKEQEDQNKEHRTFLDQKYVNELIKNGYKVVTKIELPDGDYKKDGGGYQIDILNQDGNTDTGYSIVTNNGIRGMWNGQPINVVGGTTPRESIYKILYKPTAPIQK